jgi:multiple sugar transport system substrate-binding protein
MMKVFKKLSVATLALLVAAGCGLSGCKANNSSSNSTAATKPITIKMGTWGSAVDLKSLKYMCDGVNEKVPGVSKIQLVQYPSTTDFWNSLPSQIAAGTAPDVCMLTDENSYEYIKGGLFLALDNNSMDLTNISSDATRVWTVNKKLYGFPTDMQPTCFFINLDLWKSAGLTSKDYPKTWDDVERCSKVITTKLKNVKGLDLDVDSAFYTTQVAQGFGGGWGNGKTIDTEANAAAMQWIIDMFKNGYAASSKQLGDSWDGETFSKGKAAMSIGGVWYVAQMTSGAPNTNYIALTIPQASTSQKPQYSLHSDAFVILKSCKNVSLATKAISYMGREEAQQVRMELEGMIPSNTKINSTFFVSHTQYTALEGVTKNAVSFGYPAKTSEFQTALVTNLTKAVYTSGSTTTGKEIVKQVLADYNK